MPLLGKIIKRGLAFSKFFEHIDISTERLQHQQLIHLLHKAKNTEFGRRYKFREMLKSPDNAEDIFRSTVPIHDYDKIFDEWWFRAMKDEPDICWPGIVHHYAMSSGTSGSPSKYIPVTDEMIKSIQSASVKQIFSLNNFDLKPKTFTKGILILGGSIHMNRRGKHFVGDMSGISAKQIPFWFQHHYKPGKKIAGEQDWNKKIAEIVKEAPNWDIGIVAGIPAWIQLMFEEIIKVHNLKSIHDIWPNLEVYVHGGVSISPYKKSIAKLTREPLKFIETYIASEGYVAFQKRPNEDMTMLFNNGVYFEFVPFDDENFRPDGGIRPAPVTHKISEVRPHKPYALLMSTCAGAWRYQIGDVIEFTDDLLTRIKITGRTKHFLNLCAEHLSVMNMTDALQHAENELNINIEEFTVAGITEGGILGHHWFIGSEDEIDPEKLAHVIDEQLKILNDDYRLERNASLKKFELDIISPDIFNQWMEKQGKMGGQNKFPRVLQKKQYEDWLVFLQDSAKVRATL